MAEQGKAGEALGMALWVSCTADLMSNLALILFSLTIIAGATLVPLLAPGVPGDVVTAIIMGAFMIHGLQPGLLRSGGKYVADIPRGVLFPAVPVLCIYGFFAVNNTSVRCGRYVCDGLGRLFHGALRCARCAVFDRIHSGAVAGRQFPAIHADEW